jgi:3-dehydroshikimate dehydratase
MTGGGVITPGLCSVTFRDLDVTTVARHAAHCDLRAIEWGGDVHVPPGDTTAARTARAVCEDLGIDVASYGSYIAAGRDDVDAARVALDTAVELGAPNVRVWAEGARAAADLVRLCEEARVRELALSLEYHPGTRTATAASTLELLEAAGRPELHTYWQPDPAAAPLDALAALSAVLPHVSHLHVFWWRSDYTRLPLADGAELWPDALRLAADRPRIAFLEFVRADAPSQLQADAATLRQWITDLTSG